MIDTIAIADTFYDVKCDIRDYIGERSKEIKDSANIAIMGFFVAFMATLNWWFLLGVVVGGLISSVATIAKREYNAHKARMNSILEVR